MSDSFPIYVRTLSGLERVLAEELHRLGAAEIRPKSRLVICQGDKEMLYQINVRCRTAIRVLRLIATFPARDEKEFYEGVKALDWDHWLSFSPSSGGTLAVNSHVHSSFTTHSLFLSQLTKDAVVDYFRAKTGERPSVDLTDPHLRIAASLYQNTAQIYVDSSGESLHKRGYRLDAGEAPLNETLAAGILALAEWDGTKPLVDPMCGSGTFLIEAGLFVKNIAPGLFRKRFGFQRWPDFDAKLYEKIVDESKKAVLTKNSAAIIGLDIDDSAVDRARENVKRAGLSDVVRVERGSFFSWAPACEPGTLVMNPPYGERLSMENRNGFWRQIGRRLQEKYMGWNVHVLSGNPDGERDIGFRSSGRTPLLNGSIECVLLRYDLSTKTKAVISEVAPTNIKWKEKAEAFGNRLSKNYKHYAKWASREGISCWRLYDRDIPELAFVIDLYDDHLRFSEIPRNQDHSEFEHSRYMQLMVETATTIVKTSPEKVHFSQKKSPIRPENESQKALTVDERGHRFYVKLSDPLDVGFFLEQRDMRELVKEESQGKDFLNLFSYTGSLTVYAAAGGAKSTTTVDSSRSYLEWAEQNLSLNGFSGKPHRFFHSDAIDYLKETKAQFDVCVVDPPTRAVQEDHVLLLRLVLDHMRVGGKVFFLTSCRELALNEAALSEGRKVLFKEITQRTTPFDFKKKPAFRSWMIEVNPS